MGIAFALVGVILIITGARNTYADLGAQLQKDFTGQGNFTFWAIALISVGALGGVQQLRTFSHTFMALILLSLLLSHKGFFSQFQQALATGPVASVGATPGTGAGQAPVGSSQAPLLGPTGKPLQPGVSPFNTFGDWANYWLFGSKPQ